MTDRLPLAEAVGATHARALHLIGSGGKTTVMFALAAELAGRGDRVITTTSTRIRRPPRELDGCSALVVEPCISTVIDRLASDPTWRHRTVVARRDPGAWKLAGHPADQLDRLVHSGVADHVIVEADGSAGRALKAHRADEPVIAAACDRVVAVVGLGCLGKPLDARHVHRPEIAAAIASARLGAPISTALIARLLRQPGGWLSRLPPGLPVVVLLTSAAGVEPRRIDRLAARLSADPRVQEVHAAELRGRVRFVRSV